MNEVQIATIGAEAMWPLVRLFLFVFGVIGMTHILVDSKLFASTRAWLKTKLPEKIYWVLECYQCCGTWCGFFLALCLLSYNPFIILAGGFAGSFFASWAAFHLNYLEAKTMQAMDGKTPPVEDTPPETVEKEKDA
jgi:hypothetical protein